MCSLSSIILILNEDNKNVATSVDGVDAVAVSLTTSRFSMVGAGVLETESKVKEISRQGNRHEVMESFQLQGDHYLYMVFVWA